MDLWKTMGALQRSGDNMEVSVMFTSLVLFVPTHWDLVGRWRDR